MNNSAFWSMVLVLAALTAGCGKGPDTTRPLQEATPATEKGAPAARRPQISVCGLPALWQPHISGVTLTEHGRRI